MMAAIIAARKGAAVTLFERHPRVGKKLLGTGNGRCNLTNIDAHISRYHGGNPGFTAAALSGFTVMQTIDFFEALGIAHRVEDEGKVFPRSGQASSVLDVLRWDMEERGVEVRCDTEISSLKKTGDLFTLTPAKGPTHHGECVVLAAGGRATPNLCSHGSGYPLAQQAGHTLIEPWPALVPLKLEAGHLRQSKGIKWHGNAAVIADNRITEMAEGELLFTEYGISGPPILALSRAAGAVPRRGARVELKC